MGNGSTNTEIQVPLFCIDIEIRDDLRNVFIRIWGPDLFFRSIYSDKYGNLYASTGEGEHLLPIKLDKLRRRRNYARKKDAT